MPAHGCHVLDLLTLFAEAAGLVKRQVIDGYHLGRAAQRDAVPAQYAGDFQIAWLGQKTDEDERSL
jgi:hypothetical protein